MQVDSAWSLGNYKEARRNANISHILNIIGFAIGALVWFSAIIAIIIITITSATSTVNSFNNQTTYNETFSVHIEDSKINVVTFLP